MNKVSVSAKALFQVLQALNGPDHYIRELQATRNLTPGGNPIDTLVLEYGEEIGVLDDWRRIETAPKDVSVLLYAGNNVGFYFGRRRVGRLGEPNPELVAWRCDSSGCYATATHWRPAPPVPKT